MDTSRTLYHYVETDTTTTDSFSECHTILSVSLEKNTSVTNYTKNVTNHLTFVDQENQSEHLYSHFVYVMLNKRLVTINLLLLI